ncbi:MAG TPA: prolyl oligopeptidase family serine peptidase [Microlunatus sp.]|nr:prolyl oligopeptidase family serine peptidase [Microlunatus sp.]
MSTAPYGTWPSIVTTDLVTSGTVGLSSAIFDGDTLYWLEARPDEGGRVGLWRQSGDGPREPVTPAEFNVRSRVHEYGGGAYAVRNGVVVFSDFSDGRLYRLQHGDTSAITAVSSHRYADLRVHPDRDLVLAVREDHAGDGEPVTTIVALDLHSEGVGTVLCAGADFYADPELSDDGELAWTEWNHPAMPWDATLIKRGRLVDGDPIEVAEVTDVAGGESESAVHPRWAPGGELIFVSDRTGWWNLFSLRQGMVAPLFPDEAEYATPQWVFGDQPYAVLGSGRILATRVSGGESAIVVIDRAADLTTTLLPTGLSGPLTAANNRAAALIEDTDRPARLSVVDLDTTTWTDIRQASDQALPPGWVSVPEAVSWPSTVDDLPGTVHGWYYPPTNPDWTGPDGELPPLITLSHGGPTSFADTGFNISLQYWTSRGFAVLDVNYRGSTGYGRPYRDALRGQWGIVDVADCAGGAAAMVDQGRADPRRLIVRGGSAGGYTTLRALTTTDVFTAGVSFYGVADPEALARDTHKFEARYLDSLIGPYPGAIETYRERSPILHVDRLSVPLLLLQGAEDAVVPPNQAETMAAAVRAKGLPVAMIIFDGEGHGFRQASSIQAALEAQLFFLSRVFGFEPADDLPPIKIDNL